MSDGWPERLIDETPTRKVELMLADPDRYWTQVKDERRAEAVAWVVAELSRRAEARRREAEPTYWGRAKHWFRRAS